MSRPKVEISLYWDGETPEAELIVDRLKLSGPPKVVEKMFWTLNALNLRAQHLEGYFKQTSAELYRLARDMDPES